MKIEIKEDIVEKLEERIKNTKEFAEVGEYIDYILRQVVKRLKCEEVLSIKEDSSEVTEKKIQDRNRKLESLGYLD